MSELERLSIKLSFLAAKAQRLNDVGKLRTIARVLGYALRYQALGDVQNLAISVSIIEEALGYDSKI